MVRNSEWRIGKDLKGSDHDMLQASHSTRLEHMRQTKKNVSVYRLYWSSEHEALFLNTPWYKILNII